jgi:hypothetical protein
MTRLPYIAPEHTDAVTKTVNDKAQACFQMVLNIVTITGTCRPLSREVRMMWTVASPSRSSRLVATIFLGVADHRGATPHAYRPDGTGAGSPRSAWHVMRRDRGAQCALHATVNRLIRDSEVPLIAPSAT